MNSADDDDDILDYLLIGVPTDSNKNDDEWFRKCPKCRRGVESQRDSCPYCRVSLEGD